VEDRVELQVYRRIDSLCSMSSYHMRSWQQHFLLNLNVSFQSQRIVQRPYGKCLHRRNINTYHPNQYLTLSHLPHDFQIMLPSQRIKRVSKASCRAEFMGVEKKCENTRNTRKGQNSTDRRINQSKSNTAINRNEWTPKTFNPHKSILG
jgi:hypothetical protein